MRVLISLTYYRPHVSGLTIYVERLAGELCRTRPRRDRAHLASRTRPARRGDHQRCASGPRTGLGPCQQGGAHADATVGVPTCSPKRRGQHPPSSARRRRGGRDQPSAGTTDRVDLPLRSPAPEGARQPDRRPCHLRDELHRRAVRARHRGVHEQLRGALPPAPSLQTQDPRRPAAGRDGHSRRSSHRRSTDQLGRRRRSCHRPRRPPRDERRGSSTSSRH